MTVKNDVPYILYVRNGEKKRIINGTINLINSNLLYVNICLMTRHYLHFIVVVCTYIHETTHWYQISKSFIIIHQSK